MPVITNKEKDLIKALESKGFICTSQKRVGKGDMYGYIDIAIEKSKLYIEVDGSQHYTKARQIAKDCIREHEADVDGYRTIRIPNNIINKDKDFDDAVNAISIVAKAREKQLKIKDL